MIYTNNNLGTRAVLNSIQEKLDNKRKGSTLVEEELETKKAKAELSDVPFYEIDELISDLGKIQGSDVESRISSLSQLFQEVVVDNQPVKQLWLETAKKTYLFVELSEDKFKSKAFHESAFDNSEGAKHFYLSVYEADENNEINKDAAILSVRFSNKKHGELNWIQKGRSLTGNDVADLYFLFEKTVLKGISGFTMYLYNDAGIEILIGSKVKRIDLRWQIAELGWYEKKLGYSVEKINCCTMQLQRQGKKVIYDLSQDPIVHEKALKELQTMTLPELYGVVNKYIDGKRIPEICKRVFGEDFEIKNSSKTLQDLQKAVSEKARLNKMDSQVIQDQFACNRLFRPYKVLKGSKAELRFIKNLNTINNTRILTKKS